MPHSSALVCQAGVQITVSESTSGKLSPLRTEKRFTISAAFADKIAVLASVCPGPTVAVGFCCECDVYCKPAFNRLPMATIRATILAPAAGDQRQRVERVQREPLAKTSSSNGSSRHRPETHPDQCKRGKGRRKEAHGASGY